MPSSSSQPSSFLSISSNATSAKHFMAMSQKRGRACVACASIKIKCQLGSDTSLQPPCERCVRLNKECTILAPKRQKDRVAELEAQVAALTRLLKAQGVENPEAASSSNLRESTTAALSPLGTNTAINATTPTSVSKKRRLDDTSPGTINTARSPLTPSTTGGFDSIGSNTANADTSKLDRVISRELQERVLERYRNDVAPSFPLVPITGDQTLDSLRKERPILLQAIMYAAGPGVLSLDAQEDIARLLLSRVSTSAISQGEKSLELLQAIQIVCIWYRTPKYQRHVAVYQLIPLTAGLAMDIGMNHLNGAFSTAAIGFTSDSNDLDATDCWRASLGCYSMSAAMSLFTRRENSTPWTEQHEQSLLFLPSSPVSLPSDRWLGQFFRAERLCEQIAVILEFYDQYAYRDVAEPAMKSKIQSCRNHILNWRVSIPQSLRTPLILFWEHLATAYMFEPVLHTPTNRDSFTAPYVSDRLSLTDFPAPVVTQDHITAVYELISATHAMIDLIVAYDAQTLIPLSGLFVASRAAYANYLLAKMYIAATIPGNTLGSIVDSTIIRAEEYNDKLFDAWERVSVLDERCSCTRILSSATRMREWYTSYNSNLYSENGLLNPTAGLQFDSFIPATDMAPVAGTTPPTQKAADLEQFFRFSDSAADFGLDILFSEPMLPGFDGTLGGMSFDQPNQM